MSTKPPAPEPVFDDAFAEAIDPMALFADWFAQARESEVNDAHAMALATVDEAGLPDLRMVLLNLFGSEGFTFFTNLESDKAGELRANPRAALLFHWKSLRRQVRVRGPVEAVSEAEADAYFATRPRGSQIGAHASHQSRPLASRAELAARTAEMEARFADGAVPRPAHWSGYRIVPASIEFWKDGAFRLHDRVRFTRAGAGGVWSRQRLYP